VIIVQPCTAAKPGGRSIPGMPLNVRSARIAFVALKDKPPGSCQAA